MFRLTNGMLTITYDLLEDDLAKPLAVANRTL